jgi:hypothetical protein
MSRSLPRSALVASMLSAVAVFLLTGCFNPFDPSVRGFGVTEPPPIPDSPSNVLRLLEWCYENRATFEYRELFDNDYRFVFGQLDPDGFAYRDNPWTREDELQSTTHLFLGGEANQPAATSITILLDRNFRVTADPNRPGRAHKLIRTSVTLKVVTDQQRDVTGFANFFLVRGDSATIPEELRQRGFLPDSNRWYILRHEDDTFHEDNVLQGGETSSSIPRGAIAFRTAVTTRTTAFQSSWGSLKRAYR